MNKIWEFIARSNEDDGTEVTVKKYIKAKNAETAWIKFQSLFPSDLYTWRFIYIVEVNKDE